MPAGPRPDKPRPDFPLYPHGAGQWAKKVRGVTHYFGPWADPDAALARWLDERDDLYAGRVPRARLDGVTVEDLADHFLDHKRRQVDAGELSARLWSDYHAVCQALVTGLGARTPIDQLHPDQFAALRTGMAKRLGLVSLGVWVGRARTVFRHAYASGLLEQPMRFGPGFDKPSKSAVRKARAAGPSKMLDPAQCRALIDAAGVPVRAMILLGLNAGFGQTDCAMLPASALDLGRADGWVTFPRPKTGVARRAWLWPETVAALRAATAARPAPRDPADAGLVFLTRLGQRWVRFEDRGDRRRGVRSDAVAVEFRKAAAAAGVPVVGGFYTFRRVFRTVAGGSRDREAVDLVMGHLDASMGAVYREGIGDDRVRAVGKYVRSWLWPAGGKRKPRA